MSGTKRETLQESTLKRLKQDFSLKIAKFAGGENFSPQRG
jgi:hypothetical protein